jgi:transposase
MEFTMNARSDAACFVGVDLHKDTLVACTIAAKDREVAYRKIACVAREKVREFLANLPRPSVVAIESVGFYRWLWTEAEPIVDQVVLADARGCRALAGRRIKTDREDAFNVAELLMTGRLPTAWAPPNHIQRLRDLTRHRNGLSRDHAKTLHRVKSIMNRLNRPGPARMDAAGLQRYLLASVERIEADDLMMLWQHQRRLVEVEQDRSAIERRIIDVMRAEEFRRLREILESIPGVGLITAATAIAEIGDFSRFPDAKAIGRYAGLTPTGYSSADKHRLGRICKTGSPDLRWVLQQAAWTAIRCEPAMKKVATKISKGSKTRKKAAAVAVARKLLVLMWTLARKDELYKAREPLAA